MTGHETRNHSSTCREGSPIVLWITLMLSVPSMMGAMSVGAQESLVRVQGEVVDAESGKRLPARVYVQGEDGRWFFPESVAEDGSAVPYQKEIGNSTEMHTTLSAH